MLIYWYNFLTLRISVNENQNLNNQSFLFVFQKHQRMGGLLRILFFISLSAIGRGQLENEDTVVGK